MAEAQGQVGLRDAASAAAGPGAIFDVWSRSGSKYRVRAIVLLAVNMLLFAGLGCFAFWLRTGWYLAPALDDYWSLWWQTCLPGGRAHTLTSLLTFPINVEDMPLHIVIAGLLLSALVSIPILVSILYRFYCALPFIAVVGFVGMMPWLALTLLGSCVLASVRPFRFSFRYASALLGLVLVVMYILGVSLQSEPAAAVLANPGDRIKLVAPWILAVLASCVLLALGLALAKLVNYRPGAIAPLLAMMFALPVALFEEYVGRDELYYRLLEHNYGPTSAHFRDQDVQDAFDRHVGRIHETVKPEQTYAQIASLEDLRWQFELEATPGRRNQFVEYQERAARECDWFILHFPDSRYAPNALYLKGRALDMRVDSAKLRDEKKLVFYDSYPSAMSREAWMRLAVNAPDSPCTAVALHRLALLEARAGRVDQAIDYLRRLSRFEGSEPATQPGAAASSLGRLLQTAPPESTLQVPVERVVFEGRRLLDLLEYNNDPLYGYEPLTGPTKPGSEFPRLGWLLFDPQSEHYRQNLEALLQRYPGSQLRENIEVELASTLADPGQRIAALERCIATYTPTGESARPHRDALPEALYRLGEGYLAAGQAGEARRAFQRLLQEYPGSIWRGRTERRLATLAPAAPGER